MKRAVDKKVLTASFSAPCCELRLVRITMREMSVN
jgi:hypothetical protein